ncbi:hypothetical protein CGMCC3_g8648 [Colletotrichum fructicola]|nr:uncharacterized protein CGMCC3_g8648 [Colletotrichum fructicola]KAE9575361.1 hypothetical protein CGMCC3_g8648 [Colletotrichum fructicola]
MPRLSIEAILALIGLVITVPGAWFAYLQCRSLRQARRTAQLPIWLTDGPTNHYTDHMHYQVNIMMVRAQWQWHSSNRSARYMSQLSLSVP